MNKANGVNPGQAPLWRLVAVNQEETAGRRLIRLRLANSRKTVEGIALPGRYDGPEEFLGMPAVAIDAVRSIGGAGEQTVYVRRLRIVEPQPARVLELLPASLSARPDLVDELRMAVARFRNAPLRDFVGRVLSPTETGLAFIRAPASTKFHHSYPSGLLVHSLDCARRVGEVLCRVSSDDREVAQVAALLHDIGKTRTYDASGRLSQLGLHVHHDALTLELCADALRALDAEWPWAATMLRQIWTWRVGAGSDWRKQPAMAIALSCADRLSGEFDRLATEDSVDIGQNIEPAHAHG